MSSWCVRPCEPDNSRNWEMTSSGRQQPLSEAFVKSVTVKQTFIFLISPSASFPRLVCPALTAVQKHRWKYVFYVLFCWRLPGFFLLERSSSSKHWIERGFKHLLVQRHLLLLFTSLRVLFLVRWIVFFFIFKHCSDVTNVNSWNSLPELNAWRRVNTCKLAWTCPIWASPEWGCSACSWTGGALGIGPLFGSQWAARWCKLLPWAKKNLELIIPNRHRVGKKTPFASLTWQWFIALVKRPRVKVGLACS